MQIGENAYLSIKIKGKSEELATFDNVKSCLLVETSGTSLPYICFSLYTLGKDKELVTFLQETNVVQVSIGTTAEDAETYEFIPFAAPKSSNGSEDAQTISVGGFIGDNAFMSDKGNCRAHRGNSLAAARRIVAHYRGMRSIIGTNIDKVNERPMVWRQAYGAACNFLVDVVCHMDIMPSFPIFTFDKYKKFWIRDVTKMLKEGPEWTFTLSKSGNEKELQYVNNFNVRSYKPMYNLYSGYTKVTQQEKILDGMPAYIIDENKPIAASTEDVEVEPSGNRVKLNKIQSDNVHDTYMEAFSYNTNKLMSLSSFVGVLQVPGFHPKLKPTDLVYIQTPKTDDKAVSTTEGLYFIDSITVEAKSNRENIMTYVFVTRDNHNSVEDYVVDRKKKKKDLMNIGKKALEELCNAISETRTALAVCSQVLDGTFVSYCLDFLTATKTNLLRMFSLGGIGLDFNSQAFFLQSMLCVGNNIMNMLTNMLFPDFIAYTLRDFLIDKPSMRRLLSKYIDQYVPSELQNIISRLADSLCNTQESLNSIAKANNITARSIPEVATNAVPEVEEPANIVGEIITEFEQHTQGVDIPFPVITLTESQQLQSREEIKEYIADETINNLKDLGYMDGVDESELKKVLLSDDPEVTLSFATINTLNKNAGNTFMYRYWGTYGPTNEAMYAWTYNNEVVYTKTNAISEFTRLFNEDYSPYMGNNFKVVAESENTYKVGANVLYAWTYDENTVYTKSETITENIKLYNSNYEEYTGSDFSVEKSDEGDYFIAYGEEEAFRSSAQDVGKSTTRNEALDINTTALTQLTDFYINKGFKDRYRTLPCTKLISATKNARLYFACPQSEKNIKFYINSKRVNLDSFPIDLGYVDIYGNKILYNVYYTTTGYNSNSTMLEVRQG